MTGKRRRVNKAIALETATRLFAERGYEGLSMGDLADALEIRKASLFHHFASKEELYEQVVGVLLDEVDRIVGQALTSDMAILAKLDALADALTATLGAHPHAARLLVGEAVQGGSRVRELLRRKADAVLDAGRAFVRAGQEAGIFDARLDPTHVVLSVVGLLFLPFALEDIVERFAGTLPRDAAFVAARKIAIRDQMRRLLGVRSED